MKIQLYQSPNGRFPFKEWLASLDARHQAADNRRINAITRNDHFGDCRSLKGGLFELRLLGPGLRVYFTRVGREVVLLLGGSDKRLQRRAIRLAQYRLREIKARSV